MPSPLEVEEEDLLGFTFSREQLGGKNLVVEVDRGEGTIKILIHPFGTDVKCCALSFKVGNFIEVEDWWEWGRG
jgi:hypothetical protein